LGVLDEEVARGDLGLEVGLCDEVVVYAVFFALVAFAAWLACCVYFGLI
jgi:hypothetical protein